MEALSRRLVSVAAVLLLSGASAFSAERDELPARLRIIGEAISHAFSEPATGLEDATVAILPDKNDPDDIALLGTVVSQDGFIVTKASDLPDRIWVSFANGDVERAKLIGKDRQNDVAFLKINRKTPACVWGGSHSPPRRETRYRPAPPTSTNFLA